MLQVAGLWVFLGLAIGLGAVVLLISSLRRPAQAGLVRALSHASSTMLRGASVRGQKPASRTPTASSLAPVQVPAAGPEGPQP